MAIAYVVDLVIVSVPLFGRRIGVASWHQLDAAWAELVHEGLPEHGAALKKPGKLRHLSVAVAALIALQTRYRWSMACRTVPVL